MIDGFAVGSVNNDVPDEWTFSRAFAEFSESRLPERVHEALIKNSYDGEIVGHNSRDATAIEAREKPLKQEPVEKVAAKRCRPKQGEQRIKPLTRIEKQANGMSLADMLDINFSLHPRQPGCHSFSQDEQWTCGQSV